MIERLRPFPHRGPVIAAGAVPLALAAVLIELRMRQWSLGPRFAVVALTAGVILAMGWLAVLEDEAPRAYHSVLLVAGLLLLVLALVLLAEVLGASRPPGNGGVFWVFAVEAAVALAAARRANSGACTLIAAVALGVAAESFVSLVFEPHGPGTFRAILVVLALVFIAGAVRLRDRKRRHGVQLVNAAGLAALVLAVTYAPLGLASVFDRSSLVVLPRANAPFGWKLYLLAIGFGLVAYSAADREPGPAYIGAGVLVAFAVLAGAISTARGSLVGWPLFLLLIGSVGLTIGLRPSRPVPPEPPPRDADPGPPTVPLRPVDGER